MSASSVLWTCSNCGPIPITNFSQTDGGRFCNTCEGTVSLIEQSPEPNDSKSGAKVRDSAVFPWVHAVAQCVGEWKRHGTRLLSVHVNPQDIADCASGPPPSRVNVHGLEVCITLDEEVVCGEVRAGVREPLYTTGRAPSRLAVQPPPADPVNHPDHYTWLPTGIECIDIVEHMTFNRGNVVKYVLRSGKKGDAVEDLKKARWYLDREIHLLKPKVEPSS